MTESEDILSRIAHERIPGGCDSCDAYQTVGALSSEVLGLTVHHDDWCPVLRATKSGAN